MRVNRRVVIDIESGQVIEREASDYAGPVAHAGGGSGGGGSTSTTRASIAPQLRPLFSQTAGEIMRLQNLPSTALDPFTQSQPQYIPQFSPEQNALLQFQGARAFGPVITGQEMGGLNQLSMLTGGEVGTSPYTQQAIQAASRPMLNELSMAGLGNSSAVSNVMSEAALPYIGKELDYRMQSVPMLMGLGQTLSGRQSALLGEYGQGLGAQQDLAAQQAEANFNDFLRRQAISQQLTTGVLGTLPTTGLTNSTTKTSSSQAK